MSVSVCLCYTCVVGDPVVVANSIRENNGFFRLVATDVYVGSHAHQPPSVVVVVAKQGTPTVALGDKNNNGYEQSIGNSVDDS